MKISVWMGWLLCAVCVTSVLCETSVQGDDWSQWMGNDRDGVWKETGIVSEFPAEGPKVMWKAEVGLGYAGPAVAGGFVYVADYLVKEGDTTPNPNVRNTLKGEERLQCLDATTGTQVWEYRYDCEYKISYPNGPRATPTVDGDLVYMLGAEGHLACLDSKTGTVVWGFEIKDRYKTESPIWGYASHPLVYQDLLITLAGGPGSIAIAVNKKTGEDVWKGLSASEIGYSPATLINAGGVDQLLIWDADKLNSLNPLTGDVYWSFALKPSYGMSIMPPLKAGDYLFASGIGTVGALYELSSTSPSAQVVWEGTNQTGLYSVNSAPVFEEGVVYGTDCKPGIFRAFDLKTGERLWQATEPVSKDGRPANSGTCFVIKNGAHFFLFSETGDLIIADLKPDGYHELSRAKILEPTSSAFNRDVVWSYPAFANKCCFARNDKEIVCVSLSE